MIRRIAFVLALLWPALAFAGAPQSSLPQPTPQDTLRATIDVESQLALEATAANANYRASERERIADQAALANARLWLRCCFRMPAKAPKPAPKPAP